MRLPVLIATALLLTAQPVTAENCRIDISTRKCIFVPLSQQTPPEFIVGDVFPIYEYSMLLDIDSYRLKPVDGPWRYYRSGTDIYRVSTEGYRVLEIIRNARRR